VYEFSRGTQSTEASTGEDFEFLNKRLTKKQLMTLAPAGEDEKWLEPFNYAEILAPKTPKELRAIVGGDEPVGGEDEDGDSLPPFDDDDDDDKEEDEKKRNEKKKSSDDDDDDDDEPKKKKSKKKAGEDDDDDSKSSKDLSIDDLL